MRGGPPPIIFERLKLPQHIIYRRKENLSESPNHKKYWENSLVSRFDEQFSRNRRNLGHFRKFEKISNSQNMNILYIILKHVIWRFQISKIIGGGPPRTAASFYSANMCIYTTISVIDAGIINTDIVMFLCIYSRFMNLCFGIVEALFSLPKDSLKLQR